MLNFTVPGERLTAYETILGGAHNLQSGVGPSQAILVETILTSILVLTVLLAAVDSEGKNSTAPVAIGLAVLVCILAG